MKFIIKTKIINLLVLITVVCIYFGISRSVNTFTETRKQPIYKVATEEKKVAITFDINWAENDKLYDILKILDKYDVKATFFIMGKWVVYPEGNLQKLVDIYEKGHEIGNHSYVHPDFTKISQDRIKEEIKKTEDIIDQAIGVKTELFRFPSGAYSDNGINMVNELGYKSIHWDVDSVDWKQLGLDVEYNKVIKKVGPGSIILFHNNGKYTPDNLSKLIPELKNQGYNFVKVGELIYKNNYIIENGTQRLVN